jgi:hypothetical protein
MDGYEDAFINEAEKEHVKPKDAESAAGQASPTSHQCGRSAAWTWLLCFFITLLNFLKP